MESKIVPEEDISHFKTSTKSNLELSENSKYNILNLDLSSELILKHLNEKLDTAGDHVIDEEGNSIFSNPEGTERFNLQFSYPVQTYGLNYLKKRRDAFWVIQKWVGEVKEIDQDSFFAIVRDLTINDGTEEKITFDKEELDSEDLMLLKEGAIFYWNIGYKETNGQRYKSSFIKFKRLPNIGKSEIDRLSSRSISKYSKLSK